MAQEDINQITLTGNLVRDAEAREKGPIRFSIAVNRRVKKGDQWTEEASFFDVEYWHRSILPLLTKGKPIALRGELLQHRWEQDGQSRSKVLVGAEKIKVLGSPGQPAQENQAAESWNDDDIPF